MTETNSIPTHPEAAPEPEPSSTRLIATLGLAGFLSGLLLVGAYLFTLPMIEGHRADRLREAIYEVLPGTAAYEPLVLREGELVPLEEAGEVAEGEAPEVFAGYDKGGKLTGFAVTSEEPGYQDVIAGIFGYDPEAGEVVGFKVLESKETPGLGDKIMKDENFKANFEHLAVEPEIAAVKSGEKTQPNQVEAITGATISSKAVTRLIAKGVEKWRREMEGFAEGRRGD